MSSSRKSRRQPRSTQPIIENGPVYYEMLKDAGALPAGSSSDGRQERPIKRRKTIRDGGANNTAGNRVWGDGAGPQEDLSSRVPALVSEKENELTPFKADTQEEEEEEEEGPTVAVAEEEDSDDSEESDVDWEDVELDKSRALPIVPISKKGGPDSLDLVLNETGTDISSRYVRRKITKVDRRIRLESHKIGMLCWMAHVYRRNCWCNSKALTDILCPLLDETTISLLKPEPSEHQFRRDRQFIEGLKLASQLWSRKFRITRKGIAQPPWYNLETLSLLSNLKDTSGDPAIRKVDFIEAAHTLSGSRDLGAQLFCALLRSVGITTRLVCSMQPVTFSFQNKGPVIPSLSQLQSLSAPPTETPTPQEGPEPGSDRGRSSRSRGPGFLKKVGLRTPVPGGGGSLQYTPRNATPEPPISEDFIDSPHPIYWVEAWNVATQKWICVDPLVTQTVGKFTKLAPVQSDPKNVLSYVVAFEAEGQARDVTRRYARSYNGKTRKFRVTSTKGGQGWWDKVLANFSRGWDLDRDQLEDADLTARELAEGIPNSISDLKDHPHFVLPRHLHTNQVLHPTKSKKVGSVRITSTNGGTNKETLEPVYRRQDVLFVKSPMQWYRLGREITSGEQPLKHITKRTLPKHDVKADRLLLEQDISDNDDGDVEEGTKSTGLYAEYQTTLYTPPPVLNGKVPKNAFGNIDVYVPSMVPPGGVLIPHKLGAQAAKILGIDYAQAVTGFEFKSRAATAVIGGAVVAEEYGEAVRSVVRGLVDEEEEERWERKQVEVLKLWKKFLMGLRIKERLNREYGDVVEDGTTEDQVRDSGTENDIQSLPSSTSGPYLRKLRDVKGKGKAHTDDSDLNIPSIYPPQLPGRRFTTNGEEPHGGDDFGGGGGFILEANNNNGTEGGSFTPEPSPRLSHLRNPNPSPNTGNNQDTGGGFISETTDDTSGMGGFLPDNDGGGGFIPERNESGENYDNDNGGDDSLISGSDPEDGDEEGMDWF